MPKLTYWVADRQDDSPCYSLRARTRRELTQLLAAEGVGPHGNQGMERGEYVGCYAAPRKVWVEYANAFDLVQQCMGEGGIE